MPLTDTFCTVEQVGTLLGTLDELHAYGDDYRHSVSSLRKRTSRK